MICPTGKNILIEPQEIKPEREDTTAGGIVLVKKNDDRLDLSITKGVVIACGEEVDSYKEGQTLYYNFFSGNQIVVPGKDPLGKDDKTYHIVYSGDIVAMEA